MEEELNRAMVLRKNGEFNKSTVLLIRLAEIYPFYASINYECAQSLMLVGKETESVPYFERAIRLGLPSEALADTYISLSHGYQLMGDKERARDADSKRQPNKTESSSYGRRVMLLFQEVQ